MRKALLNILIAAAALTAGEALAADPQDGPGLSKPPFGSIASQLLLKHKLARQSEGTLVASLEHNRNDWQNLSPDQREGYRRQALAFLKESPEQQEELIARYDKLIKLDAQQRDAYRKRAKWLNAVVATYSASEREELMKMTPEDRARKLIDRRDELVRQGKLTLEEPATQPGTASAPTTQAK